MGRLADNPYTGLRFPSGSYPTSGGRTNVLLNSALVFGTSGAAMAIRYQARSTDPITDFYIMADTAIGNSSNINLSCKIRNEHASSATQPGTTIRATSANAAYGIAAPPKWIRFTFPTPYTPAIGETLWFVVENVAVAPTVDYPGILASFNAAPAYNILQGNQGHFSTTGGFVAAGTSQSRVPFVVVQGGKSYGYAASILNAAVLASSTALRGFQIKPPVNIEVSGWQTAIPNTNMVNLRIYDNAVPPSGSPLYSFALGTQTNQNRDELIGAKYWPPVILTGGTTYNVVTSWATAASIGGATIEDYASFPAVFDDLVDGFVNCWPVSDVGNVWTLQKGGFINQNLIVSDLIAPAAAVRRPKIWNGSTWQEKPMGVWNGSVWVQEPLKIWNGSAWV
jgi:hypothetical protein